MVVADARSIGIRIGGALAGKQPGGIVAAIKVPTEGCIRGVKDLRKGMIVLVGPFAGIENIQASGGTICGVERYIGPCGVEPGGQLKREATASCVFLLERSTCFILHVYCCVC